MKNQLLIIDPQVDFCDPKGALYVKGAEQDMVRLATMIKRLANKIDQIHVTLDSHRTVDIAHPIFWVDKNGKHPKPFQGITLNSIIEGDWITTDKMFDQYARVYTKKLEESGRYPLTIWPSHCRIGSWGGSVYPELDVALVSWEETFKIVDYIPKGSNILTEHYSAIKAEVVDPNDPTTDINRPLLNAFGMAENLYVAGEALDYCLANTVRDMVANGIDPNKITLINDATSSVGFPAGLGDAFVKEMTAKGMKLAKSTEVMI
jgi:nicotinamidase-related amidase